MAIQNPVVLTEVQEIEIVETYKKLIGTAKVIFPKGTVYKKHDHRKCHTVSNDASYHHGNHGRRGNH